jgi:hypothetical protein
MAPHARPSLRANRAAPEPAPRPAWQSADPHAVKCTDYAAHQSFHRRCNGEWRCWRCFPIGDELAQ